MAEKRSSLSKVGELVYHFEDKLTLWGYFVYGFQQLLVMDSVFALPVILGHAFHLPAAQIAYLIQATLIGAGVTTLLQSAVLLRLPVAQGIGAAATVVAISLAALKFNLATVSLAFVFSMLIILFLLAPIIPSKGSRKSILEVLLILIKQPQVYGVLITLIGISLIGAAFSLINAGGYKPLYNIGSLITVTMILALIFIFRRGILRFGAILIGILVGAIYSYAVHIMSTQEIIEAPLIALPRIWPWGLESIQWNLVSAGLVPILIASLMLPTEAIGVYYTVGALDNVTITDERVRKGILGETLGSLVSLLFGSLSTTTYAQNVGAIAVTRVGARRVFTATGILLIILGLIPKIGAIIVSIPGPILGSAFVIIYSMLLLTGISVLADMDWTDKNAVIVAVSLGVALGIQYVPSIVIAQLPLYIRTIMSPLIIGTLMAIVLNLIVNLIPQWVKANKANKEDTA